MAGRSIISVQQSQVRVVGDLLKTMEDGAQLRKDLIKDLRLAVAPGISQVRAKLQAMPHDGSTPSSPPMGSYLSSRVRAQVKLSGRRTGVAVRIGKTPKLRGFNVSSRALNRGKWRHRVFGTDKWVEQISPIPDFFDKTLADRRGEYRVAVLEAVARMKARIEERTRAARPPL